jgi:predicted MFS family arabinose efflux permease
MATLTGPSTTNAVDIAPATTPVQAACTVAIREPQVREPERSGRGRRLPSSVAFALQVSMLVSLLGAASAPTPLYRVYQAEWGFSPIAITVVFGVYALAVLGALLTVGSLSDHIGRRPVLLSAIALQVASLVVFTTAGSVSALLVARVVQGLSTGAAIGALGAGLLDIDRAKGTIANGVGAVSGTASGALGSALLVQFLPEPTHLVYLVLIGIFALQGVGVVLMRETATPKAGALASLRPQLAVPRAARRPLVFVAPALVAVWALAGFYGSLGPTLVHVVTGSNSVVLGGLSLFVLAASAAVTLFLIRSISARAVMLLGTSSLVIGVGITLLAINHASAVGFFVGTAIAGVGFGAGFQGALRSVLPLAALHQRAGVLSAIYVVCYLAMGLPAVGAGFLVEHLGLLTTAREYGVVVIVLAALAFADVARPRRVTA